MNSSAAMEWPGRAVWMVFLVSVLGLLAGSGCSPKSKISNYIQRGSDYIAKGDYLKAEIEFLNVLRLDPGNTTAHRQLGEVYFQQGSIVKAFQHLKRVVDSGATDEELRIKMARIYLTGRKMKEAREEATAILQSKPDSTEALVVLSQAALTTNEVREVATQLEALRSRAENSPGFHVAIGTLAARQNNLKQAEESFNRALALGPKLSVCHELMANVQFRMNDMAKAGAYLKTAAELAPVRSVTPLRYAEFLKDSGDEAGARKKVEEQVKNAPDYLPASVQLAQLLFAAKQYDQCAEVTKRILAMDLSNEEALLLNGRLLLARGERAKALQELERLAQLYPRAASAHYHLAIARLLNNDASKALSSLAQAVALDPDYADAILLQAELNLRRGDAPSVITAMTDLLRGKPHLGRAYIILGDAYGMRENYAEALSTYQRMSQLFAKSPIPHQLMGGVLVRLNRLGDARASFQKALDLAPNYFPAFEQLVEVDMMEKKFPEALARVQPEAQKHPQSVPILVLLAKANLGATNNTAAEANLRKAMELEPDSITPPILLAQLLTKTGRATEALASLRQTSAKKSTDFGILMLIGMLETEAGNHAAARDAYEQILKIKPDFGPALNNLAYAYSEYFNKLDRAYELARKASELDPNNEVARDTLGWILFKRGDYRWALDLLRQSSHSPKLSEEPEAFYHLGMVQYMMGNEEGARTSLTRATSLPKKFTGREDAAQRLQLLNLDFAKADAATLAKMQQHLANNPGDPVVAGRLAELEEKKGNFDKALSIYERAIAANKGDVAAMLRAARIYAERQKNPKKALELAKEAREASPDDPMLGHTVGALAYTAGDPTWAVNLLEESSRNLANNPDVLYDLALAQYAVGRVADSEATMQRAISLGGAFSRLEAGKRWLTISSLYKDPARLRQSGSALGEWLKVDPSSPAVLIANGALHELQNNPSAAEQSYTHLLSLYPSFTPASIRLVSLQATRPETLPKAYETATRLRQALPTDAEVARLLGLISYRRGDYVRAAQLLSECSRALKADTEVWYHLGLAHHQLKQKEEARQALGKVLTLESTGSMATEARRILGELK